MYMGPMHSGPAQAGLLCEVTFSPPVSRCPLQVVIEAAVERKSFGNIAVDDIKILDNLNMADCKGEGTV